jgi:hypothetical protein
MEASEATPQVERRQRAVPQISVAMEEPAEVVALRASRVARVRQTLVGEAAEIHRDVCIAGTRTNKGYTHPIRQYARPRTTRRTRSTTACAVQSTAALKATPARARRTKTTATEHHLTTAAIHARKWIVMPRIRNARGMRRLHAVRHASVRENAQAFEAERRTRTVSKKALAIIAVACETIAPACTSKPRDAERAGSRAPVISLRSHSLWTRAARAVSRV